MKTKQNKKDISYRAVGGGCAVYAAAHLVFWLLPSKYRIIFCHSIKPHSFHFAQIQAALWGPDRVGKQGIAPAESPLFLAPRNPLYSLPRGNRDGEEASFEKTIGE